MKTMSAIRFPGECTGCSNSRRQQHKGKKTLAQERLSLRSTLHRSAHSPQETHPEPGAAAGPAGWEPGLSPAQDTPQKIHRTPLRVGQRTAAAEGREVSLCMEETNLRNPTRYCSRSPVQEELDTHFQKNSCFGQTIK